MRCTAHKPLVIHAARVGEAIGQPCGTLELTGCMWPVYKKPLGLPDLAHLLDERLGPMV